MLQRIGSALFVLILLAGAAAAYDIPEPADFLAVGDYNADGKSDLLWRNAATGATTLWLMNGNSFSSFATLITDPTWLLSPPNGL